MTIPYTHNHFEPRYGTQFGVSTDGADNVREDTPQLNKKILNAHQFSFHFLFKQSFLHFDQQYLYAHYLSLLKQCYFFTINLKKLN